MKAAKPESKLEAQMEKAIPPSAWKPSFLRRWRSRSPAHPMRAGRAPTRPERPIDDARTLAELRRSTRRRCDGTGAAIEGESDVIYELSGPASLTGLEKVISTSAQSRKVACWLCGRA